jgi:quercetin dioxygenase-like cupin family protein
VKDLKQASAFSQKSPYEIWQEWEEIPAYKGFIIQNLLELQLEPWARTGGKAAFVNLDGAGGTCDIVVQEIRPGGELKPMRHLYEKGIFVLQGQGATTIWNEGGKKHTLEWQAGSLFSPPLNTWHQHFNAQGSEPVRLISLPRLYLQQSVRFFRPISGRGRRVGQGRALSGGGQEGKGLGIEFYCRPVGFPAQGIQGERRRQPDDAV